MRRTTKLVMAAFWLCLTIACFAGASNASADTVNGESSSAGMPAAGVAAQPQPQPRADAIDEIVVTAERHNESLSKVPVAVSAMTGAQLQAQNVTTTADLARVFPSFQSTVSAQSGAPVFTLRGVGFNSANITSTAPVGLYVDEVAYAYPLMADGELFDLQRVEVLEGPQGTLYGRNTTGGLIDYVPSKPTSTPEASLTADGGNYGTGNFSGFISGPLTDTLKGRLAFSSQNRFDGWQQSVTRDDRLGVLHRDAVRGILDWDPTSRVTVEASFNFWQRTGDTQAAQAISSTQANPSAPVRASIINPTRDNQADWTPRSDQPSEAIGISRPTDSADNKFYAAAIRAAFHMTDQIDIVSLTSYNRLSFDQFNDSAGVQTEQLDVEDAGNIDSFSQELRAVGTFHNTDWSIGGYYADDQTAEFITGFSGEDPTIQSLRQLALSVPSRYTATQILDSFGVFGAHGIDHSGVISGFGNIDYKILQNVKFDLGARFTNDRVHFIGAQYDQNGIDLAFDNIVNPILVGHSLPAITANGSQTLNATNTGYVVVNETQSVNNVAWHTSLSWTPTDTSLYYVAVSRGYKSGEFPTIPASSIDQIRPIAQEQLTDYEAGTKLSLFDRRLEINASGFYYDYRNRQVYGQIPDLIFGTLPAVVNVPKSLMYGADGDIRWAIMPTLNATLAASALQTRIDQYYGSDQFGVFHNYRGANLPFSPKFSGFGTIAKDFQLFDTVGFQISVNASYQSTSYSDIGSDPSFRIAPYALAGASLSLYESNTNKWRVTAYIQNMFDKYYWTTAQVSHDTVVRFAGMPQTYGLRLTYKF
jgi:iron complex outermembrane recepter protein